MRPIVAALFCFGLAACATPTHYVAAARPDSVGYSEVRIEPGRYRVTFQGGDGAPAGQVEDYAMRRAAEIALRDGYDWFQVVDRSGGAAPPRSSSQSVAGRVGTDEAAGWASGWERRSRCPAAPASHAPWRFSADEDLARWAAIPMTLGAFWRR